MKLRLQDLDKADTSLVAAACLADPVLFCRYFLPEHFSKPMPWVHQGLLAILTKRTDFLWAYGNVDKIARNFLDMHGQPIFVPQEKKIHLRLGRYTLVLLPRGFSKTTICGQAAVLYNILYLLCPFTFYLSESATHAKMQGSNVRRELADNPRIKRVFGELKPKMSDDEKWAEHFFETLSGMAVGAQGRGGQVRGMNHRGQRPKQILIDDVEDIESVANDTQRKKAKEWLYADVLPALPPLDSEATVNMLGTVLHQDALTITAMNDSRFTTVKFGCFDRDGEPLWPAVMDRAKYDKLKTDYAKNGLLHRFYMEYDNEIKASEQAMFKLDYVPDYYGKAPPADKLQISIYCDPAISEDRRADECVISVVGMEEGGRLWKLDEWGQIGATPRMTVDKFFELRQKWGRPRRNGVEANAYQVALVHLLREEMFRKKDYFEVEEVKHKQKKELRIEGILQPRYASKYIYHARAFPEYDVQLLDWPTPKRKDRADAMAGAVALLDPYAAMAAGDTDLGEDEGPPIEQVLGGTFRSI